MKLLKRISSVILCVVMLALMLPGISVMAAEPDNSPPQNIAQLTDSGLSAVAMDNTFKLKEGWKIQSSALVTQSDIVVGSVGADVSGWYPASVPNTVLGALIDAGDPTYAGYDIYADANFALPDRARFQVPWWYRNDFTLPASENGKKVILNLEKINYKAEIYINGTKVTNQNVDVPADMLLNRPPEGTNVDPVTPKEPGTAKIADQYSDFTKYFIGAYRSYELDVTSLVTCDGTTPNTIAIKITQPIYSKDLTVYWVDWHMQPPDNNMGILGNVFINTTGDVRVRNPFVTAKVSNDLKEADLTLYADLSNASGAEVTGKLTASVKDPAGTLVAEVIKDVTVKAKAYNQEVEFSSTDTNFAALKLNAPSLWWPNGYGAQPLYTVDFTFRNTAGDITDTLTNRFGVREISFEVHRAPFVAASEDLQLESNMMQLYINKKPIVMKGGGYCPTDLLLRHSDTANKAVVQYCKDMGFNMIRDEGKFFDDDLISLMDENGIMLMTGWCCCDQWQQPATFNKHERFIAYESLYSQLRQARSHASMVDWFNGSDNPPGYATGSTANNGKSVERSYMEIEANLHWYENGVVTSSGSAIKSSYTGVSGGMHMDATYDYAPPIFNYVDPQATGYSYVSEGGPGPSIPQIEVVKKIITDPANQLPYNVGGNNYVNWNYHNTRGSFATLAVFNRAMDSHYGASDSLEKYVMKAQIQQYEAQRAQFESVNLHRYVNSSGLLQWMLNNARPAFFWNNFDFYLNPNGSYFGAKIANEPLHIMYDPSTRNVSVINSTFDEYKDMAAKVTVYDINGNVLNEVVKDVDLAPDGASDPVNFGTDADAITPKKVGIVKNDDGTFSDFNVNYNGMVETATGVSTVATQNEIFAPISKALSDVYFVRLELDDASGNAVSINSYAQPVKQDVMKTISHNWSSTPQYEYADLTQLNSLPAVDLDVTKTDSRSGDTYFQTITLKNNTSTIAYGINLKPYKSETELLAPVVISDNLFTLFPGESRTVTLSYDKSAYDGVATVKWECYNNICSETPARVIPATTSIGSKTANLAKNRTDAANSGTIGNTVNVDASAAAAGCVAADVSTNRSIERFQIETAAVAAATGKVTASGNILVVVTASGMTSSTKTITVPVASGNSTNTVASTIRTALSADADVTAKFTVGGSSSNVILTSKVPGTYDAALNISISKGTSEGITDKPTSTHTSMNNDFLYLYVDLGANKSFDRVILRWNYITRPGRVDVQVAQDGTAAADLTTNNAAWTTVATQTVDQTGSSVNDLILPAAVSGRYVRVLPSLPRPAAPALGMVTGANQSGINSAAEATNYQLTAFEIYSLDDKYVVANMEQNISMKINGGAALTQDSTIFDRTAFVPIASDVTLEVTPTTGGALSLFVNGVNVIPSAVKDENGVYRYTITGIDADSIVFARFVPDELIAARTDLEQEMTSGKYTAASVASAQGVIDNVVNKAILDGMDIDKLAELLMSIADAKAALTLRNQVHLTVAPNVILGEDRSITFRVSVDYLQGVNVIESWIKINDARFQITDIKALYEGDNFIFTQNPDFKKDGTTAYFSLAQIGGFADAAKVDIVDVTIKLKEGETAPSLVAVLDSISMYVGYIDEEGNHLDATVPCIIVDGGAAAVNVWIPSDVTGDFNGDKAVSGADLAIAMTYFGARIEDADWYTSGAWRIDFNNDQVIDIADLTISAYLAANLPIKEELLIEEESGTVDEPDTGDGSGTVDEPDTDDGSGTVDEPDTGDGSGTVDEPDTGDGSGTVDEPDTGDGSGIVDGSGT